MPETVSAPAAVVNGSAHHLEENLTEEEKAHNYMRNTELLVKVGLDCRRHAADGNRSSGYGLVVVMVTFK